MLGELGGNQIILASPQVVSLGSSISSANDFSAGVTDLPTDSPDPACKQTGVQGSTVDLEQNAPDLLVIEDDNSLHALNIDTHMNNSKYNFIVI